MTEIEEAIAEVERLQRAKRRALSLANRRAIEAVKVRAEVERLRKLNAELLKHDGEAEAVCNSYAEENQRLSDEVKRRRTMTEYLKRNALEVYQAGTKEMERLRAVVRDLEAEVRRLKVPPIQEREAAALTILARCNIPPDVQGLLIYGDAMRGIAPGALAKALGGA